jgi:hypothetical protein
MHLRIRRFCRLEERAEARERGPVVYDFAGQEIGDLGVAAQGREDGDYAEEFVGLEEGGEIGEGGY